MAIGLGAAAAYYQGATGPESEHLDGVSTAAAEVNRSPRSSDRSSAVQNGPHPVEPNAGAGRSGAGPKDAAPQQSAAKPPEPKRSHLPEFFANALGNPAPGSLVEGTPHELQARMDGEPRDEKWAANVEWQIENYLALRPFADRLGLPSVECRKTVCRVLATADKRALAAAPDADWHEMMSALRYESVSNEFSDSAEMIVLNASHPDRVGFVTYFDRKD